MCFVSYTTEKAAFKIPDFEITKDINLTADSLAEKSAHAISIPMATLALILNNKKFWYKSI